MSIDTPQGAETSTVNSAPAGHEESCLALVARIMLLTYAILFLSHLMTHRPLELVNRLQGAGADIDDFYRGAELLVAGTSPYRWPEFVTPPLSAYLLVPLLPLSFSMAIVVFFVVNAACIVGAVTIAARRLLPGVDLGRTLSLLALLCAFSYPVQFALERGNIDLVVCILTISALAVSDRKPVVAGTLLAVAMHLKIYPALLIAPLWLLGRRRMVGVAVIGGVALIALNLPLFAEYVSERLGERALKFEFSGLRDATENVSVPGLMLFLGEHLAPGSAGTNTGALTGVGFAIWAALLLAMLWMDLRGYSVSSDERDSRGKLATLLLYLPFMIAVPVQVYQYQLSFLLFVIPAIDCIRDLAKRAELLPEERLLTAAIGVALAPIVMASSVLDVPTATWIPSGALLAILVLIPIYRVRLARQNNTSRS